MKRQLWKESGEETMNEKWRDTGAGESGKEAQKTAGNVQEGRRCGRRKKGMVGCSQVGRRRRRTEEKERSRGGTEETGSTCWRLLLQTQCCQPPSAPLESRQEVQLGRR